MCNTEQLVSYVYEELGASERVRVRASPLGLRRVPAGAGGAARHADICSRAGRRRSLSSTSTSSVEPRRQPRRRDVSAFVPQWALGAAAALLLAAGVAAVANLEVRYGTDGLVVRTGWMHGLEAAGSPSGARRQRRAGYTRSAASSDRSQRTWSSWPHALRDPSRRRPAQLTRAAAPARDRDHRAGAAPYPRGARIAAADRDGAAGCRRSGRTSARRA